MSHVVVALVFVVGRPGSGVDGMLSTLLKWWPSLLPNKYEALVSALQPPKGPQ